LAVIICRNSSKSMVPLQYRMRSTQAGDS
jgi:hypothetical protein